jgi:hypothetical protein
MAKIVSKVRTETVYTLEFTQDEVDRLASILGAFNEPPIPVLFDDLCDNANAGYGRYKIVTNNGVSTNRAVLGVRLQEVF